MNSQTCKHNISISWCIFYCLCKCMCVHVLLYVFVFKCVCACVSSTLRGAMPRCWGLCCKRGAVSQACGNKPSFSPLSPTLSHSSHPVYLCFTPVNGDVACSEHRRGKTHTHMCKGHQILRKKKNVRVIVCMCVYVFASVCASLCGFFPLLTTVFFSCRCFLLMTLTSRKLT